MANTPITVPPVLERHAVPDKCPGALRMFEASDGKIARVRLAGSPLTVAQLRAIGEMADTLGDGHVLFTTRANVQLRGLDDDDAAAFAERVAELGLLPSATHERTRNIVVSPFSGLRTDGEQHPDLVPLAQALDRVIQDTPALTGLAGRFLIGLDDGSGFLASLPLDLTVQAAGRDLVLALGSRDDDRCYAVGSGDDPEPAARLLGQVCETWLAVKTDSGEDVWNVDDLSHGARADLHRRVAELAPAAGVTVSRADRQPRLAGGFPAGDGTVTVVVKAPMAAIPAAGWVAAADVAEQGAGELRVTPWHAMVIPGVPADQAEAALTVLGEQGWVVDAGSPWIDVHACTGLPHCARSHADVQDHARALVDMLRGPGTALPVMLSGCARQCGHPATSHHALVAEDADSYTMFLHDGSHDPQDGPTREKVSSAQAIAILTTAGSNA